VDRVAYYKLLINEGEVDKAFAEIHVIKLLIAGERVEIIGD
jgi:hypothetical protein